MKPQHHHSPWHEGERALHAQIGAAEELEALGRLAIRAHMPPQHQRFYAALPFVAAGLVDPAGYPWATLLQGPPGFAQATAADQLQLSTAPDPADPAISSMRVGAPIGLLGIELQSRRRNRANGVIRQFDSHKLEVSVTQTMGNCPKYIQQRTPRTDAHSWAETDTTTQELSATSEQYRRAVRSADTFFVASYADNRGVREVDVSHRGGKPGFVAIDSQGNLTIPDYPGNRFFNTLGNIRQSHRAGLLFPHFETGGLIQLTGHAELLPALSDSASTRGAERHWRVRPTRIVLRQARLAHAWALQEASPFNP